jgi:hypothetical protein
MPLDDIRYFLTAYAITISVETPVLLVGLSTRHKIAVKFLAGIWLTACTFPLLSLVLPVLMDPFGNRFAYVAVGETLVIAGEIGLFWLAFVAATPWISKSMARDAAAIILANIASFAFGLWLSKGLAGPWAVVL